MPTQEWTAINRLEGARKERMQDNRRGMSTRIDESASSMLQALFQGTAIKRKMCFLCLLKTVSWARLALVKRHLCEGRTCWCDDR